MMEYVELGKLANFINGYAFKPSDWGDKGLRIIRIQNLTDTNKLFNRTTKLVPEKFVVRKGDLLISWSATLGIFEWQDEEDALLNQHIFKVVLDQELVEKKYFMYVLEHTISRMLRLTHGSTMKHIVRDDFLSHEMLIPSLEEQRMVVKILDAADSLRQKRKQAINLLDDYLKSVFLDMFGDPETNSREWETRELKYFGEIITGNTPSRNIKENYIPRFIEWIKTDNIVSKSTYLTSAEEYLSETGLKNGRVVEKGAILMACIAGSLKSIGKVAIADREVSFNQQINAIQPREEVNSYFLYWLLKISQTCIQNHATHGMKKIITKGELEKIKMIFPPVTQQIKFAETVKIIEPLKQKMLEQSKELDNQFQALMQNQFTLN